MNRHPDAPRKQARAVGLALLDDRVEDYGQHARTDLIELLPVPLGRVLDVGCAGGRGAQLLRDRGAARLVGIDIDSNYCALAARRYDEVVCASIERELPWSPESFDTILCYDVLEHLVDPWGTLTRLRPLLAQRGRIHIAVPNARHPGTWMPLVMRGTFDYRGQGLRDVTHLRFFSRRDLRAMIEAADLEVAELDVVPAASRAMNLAIRLTRGRAKEFAAYQWHAIATQPSRGTDPARAPRAAVSRWRSRGRSAAIERSSIPHSAPQRPRCTHMAH